MTPWRLQNFGTLESSSLYESNLDEVLKNALGTISDEEMENPDLSVIKLGQKSKDVRPYLEVLQLSFEAENTEKWTFCGDTPSQTAEMEDEFEYGNKRRSGGDDKKMSQIVFMENKQFYAYMRTTRPARNYDNYICSSCILAYYKKFGLYQNLKLKAASLHYDKTTGKL